MHRKKFLKSLVLLSLTNYNMKLKELDKMTSSFNNTKKMPVLFLGHGNPMNAIEENEFVSSFQKLGRELTKPNAILCISAHWETKGTYITAMQNPPTIHDFGGFPKALFDVQYPAPGSPELAKQIESIVTKTKIELDHEWGLDHGAWSVIRHLYPNADIPVIQMSIDYTKPAKYHYELAKELNTLRKKGVLIIGSGNIVHNLRRVKWDKLNEEFAFDWALETNEKIKSFILNNNHVDLINFKSHGTAFDLSIPTPEHYLPLIYSFALKEKNENILIFNDKHVAGSISMTSLKIG